MKNEKDQVDAFLDGRKWSERAFATNEDLEKILRLVKENKHPKPTMKLYSDIERCFNLLALDIIRFAACEWGIDYYNAVYALASISNWFKFYEKKYKFGKHFSL